MRLRFTRALVKVLFAMTLLAMRQIEPADAQNDVRRDYFPPGFAVRLESNSSDYRIGDPILLKFTLKNNSTQTAFLSAGPTVTTFRLEMRNSNGELVIPKASIRLPVPDFPVISRLAFGKMRPGAEGVSAWNGKSWNDLRAWHLGAASAGHYQLKAYLWTGYGLPPIPSNSIEITVTDG